MARDGQAMGPKGQGRLQNTSGGVKPEVVSFLTSRGYLHQISSQVDRVEHQWSFW